MVPTRRQAIEHPSDNPSSQPNVAGQTQNAASPPSSGSATQSISGQPGGSSSATEEQHIARRTRAGCAKSAMSASRSQPTPAQVSRTTETSSDRVDDGAPGSSKASTDGENHNAIATVNDESVSKPLPKRRKKNGKWTAKMKLAASVAREAKKSLLRSFMHLPQDVVLEMFSHLNPKALLAIARTSKDLRAMIFSKRHADVWKNSRGEFSVPEPPEGLSEPRWASLLFDSACCQVCWKATDAELNWHHLRRTCPRCKEAHSVSLPVQGYPYGNHSRSEQLELVDIEIMQYVPHGRLWTSFWRTEKLFWDDDVVGVLKEWQELARPTDAAGRNAFHEWKTRRREAMRNHLNMIPIYRLWKISSTYPSKRLIKHKEERAVIENQIRKVDEIKARLREAGYKSEDIDMCILLDSPIHLGTSPAVTDLAWANMRSKFESDVEEHRAFRLALEMEDVTRDRLLVLEDVYQEFLNTLQPSEQYFCPPLSALRVDPSITSILEADRRVVVNHAYFRAKAENMRTYVDKRHRELKEWLRGETGLTDSPWQLASLVFQRLWHPSDGPLKRALDRVLVGWDMIATHSYSGHSKEWLRPGVPVEVPRQFVLNSRSSSQAEDLLAAAGLSRATTVKMMDRCDPRFVCEPCDGGRLVFTLRAALAHLHDNEFHKMRLANEGEAKAAKNHEGPAREQAKAWSCNHCTHYLEADNADTKRAILDHLADQHDIAKPQLPQDYFVNERCRFAYEVPFAYEKVERASGSREEAKDQNRGTV